MKTDSVASRIAQARRLKKLSLIAVLRRLRSYNPKATVFDALRFMKSHYRNRL